MAASPSDDAEPTQKRKMGRVSRIDREELVEILRKSAIVRRAEQSMRLILWHRMKVDSDTVRALLAEDWLHRTGTIVRFAVQEPPSLVGILNQEAARHRLEDDPRLRGIPETEEPRFESEFAEEVYSAMVDRKRGEAEIAALVEEHLEMRLELAAGGEIIGYRLCLFGLIPDLDDFSAQERRIQERKTRENVRAHVMFGVYREKLERTQKGDPRI